MQISKEKPAFFCKCKEAISEFNQPAANLLEGQTNNVAVTRHQVFPGIELVYNDIHANRCDMSNMAQGNIIEINHCREGRIEREFHDDFFYLTPGDLSINKKNMAGHQSMFPLSHYHGITIIIDIEKAPNCMSYFLDDVNVSPSNILEKFCKDNSCFITRSKPCVEHIFSELYAVPECIKKGYLKVKILELMLFLSSIELNENETERHCLPKNQVLMVKEISRYLAKHIDSRITIAHLAKQFHISQTALKNSFKGVYGVSVYTYIREQKMHMAALLLQQTDHSVLEIAGRCGYDNASKFAGAFRTVMGVLPVEYRTQKRSLLFSEIFQ